MCFADAFFRTPSTSHILSRSHAASYQLYLNWSTLCSRSLEAIKAVLIRVSELSLISPQPRHSRALVAYWAHLGPCSTLYVCVCVAVGVGVGLGVCTWACACVRVRGRVCVCHSRALAAGYHVQRYRSNDSENKIIQIQIQKFGI